MGYLGTKPANQIIDSTLIADGTVTPSDLSTGAPYWSTLGNIGVGTTNPSSFGSTGKYITLSATEYPFFESKNSTAGSSYFGSNPTGGYIGTGGAYPLVFATNNTERIRIPANAGGIQFPATQVASSDANTLDDYEEGTFTPSFRGENAISSISYNVRIGRYVKIGRLVVATCRVGIDSRSGGSGSLAVSGFPFTFWDVENFQAGAIEYYGFTNFPSNIFSIKPLSIGGTDYMNLLWNGSGTRTNVGVDSLVGGSGLIITVAYQIA